MFSIACLSCSSKSPISLTLKMWTQIFTPYCSSHPGWIMAQTANPHGTRRFSSPAQNSMLSLACKADLQSVSAGNRKRNTADELRHSRDSILEAKHFFLLRLCKQLSNMSSPKRQLSVERVITAVAICGSKQARRSNLRDNKLQRMWFCYGWLSSVFSSSLCVTQVCTGRLLKC